MAKDRDTFTYVLKDGRRVVYIGTTNDGDRREDEHLTDGKRFTRLLKTSSVMTPEGAEKAEAKALARYRRSHGGRNPKYNETDDG